MVQSSDLVSLNSFYSSALICALKTQAAFITAAFMSARQLDMNKLLLWKTFSKASTHHNINVYEKKKPHMSFRHMTIMIECMR